MNIEINQNINSILIDCDEWKYGIGCQFSCNCNITLSEYCDAVNGTCKCKAGWDGETCEEDIDECVDNTVCPENSKCINYLGKFDCVCLDGFIMNESKLCTGIFFYSFLHEINFGFNFSISNSVINKVLRHTLKIRKV